MVALVGPTDFCRPSMSGLRQGPSSGVQTEFVLELLENRTKLGTMFVSFLHEAGSRLLATADSSVQWNAKAVVTQAIANAK